MRAYIIAYQTTILTYLTKSTAKHISVNLILLNQLKDEVKRTLLPRYVKMS